MKYLILAIALLRFPSILHAQDRTLNSDSEPVIRKGKVLVIPNNLNMYRSDDDRELASYNKMQIPQVRRYLREKTAEEIWLAVKQQSTSLILHPSDPVSARELEYIYISTGFQAEVIENQETSQSKPLDKIFKNPSTRESEDNGTKISKGQLTVQPQMEEKYMRTTVTNDNLIPSLKESYGSEIFVFIGEIDLLLAPGTRQEDIMSGRYNKEFRVHYTIMDEQKSVISSGISTCLFPNRMLSLSKIREKCIVPIATDIASKIPAAKQ